MTIQQTPLGRRTVLGSIFVGITTGLAGCSALSDSDDDDPPVDSGGEILQNIEVEGLELVIEIERDAVDQLNLIEPSGELFAQQPIESGVSKTAIEIGADYPIGEYVLIGLADEDTVETTSITLEPNLELTELRLARDHPEEMYEGASDSILETGAILTVANSGAGPSAVTTLRFDGDVPNPTHESYDGSGIYDPDDGLGADAELVVVPAGEDVVLYSNLEPFTLAASRISCTPSGEEGEFTVRLDSTHNSEGVVANYSVEYSGTDHENCTIDIERIE